MKAGAVATLMDIRRTVRRLIVGGATFAACITGAFGIHQAAVYQGNMGQLSELSRQLALRAELAVDYAVLSLSELVAADLTRCSTAGIAAARATILRRGSVKDIEVLDQDGRLSCAAFGAVMTSDQDAKTFMARNDTISLQQAGAPGQGLFRVMWQFGEMRSLAAVLNIDTMMFDVFPAALRERSRARVTIGGTDLVAAYGTQTIDPDRDRSEVLMAQSSRYPVEVQLDVEVGDIAAWRSESLPWALLLGGAVGLGMGYLAASAIGRPRDPVAVLRTAVRRGEVQPFFQPIFSLSDRRIVGCEMLARWIEPDGTIVPPDRFIPLAESSGLIVEMTDVLLASALQQMRPILLADPAFKMTFNVTPAHFLSSTFLDDLSRAVDGAGVARKQVVIELTERQSFDDVEAARAMSCKAQGHGFRIALDDTGAGHNGLSRVQDVPVNIIKIDKKFVDHIATDRATTAIVQMLVRLAHEVGASTVGEGIETEAQAQTLAACGVEEGQGYLVSPALPHDHFAQLLLTSQAALSDAATVAA